MAFLALEKKLVTSHNDVICFLTACDIGAGPRQRPSSQDGRDGPRFGETEADFCLRFGLSVNRIFGSETEESLRRSRAEHNF